MKRSSCGPTLPSARRPSLRRSSTSASIARCRQAPFVRRLPPLAYASAAHDVLRKVPLQSKTPLRRTPMPVRKTPLRRGTSVLLRRTKLTNETAEHRSARHAFHEACFRIFGSKCYFCGGKATDAMHIIPRRLLSRVQRYARPDLNSRPGCRACHRRTEHDPLAFPKDVVAAATLAIGELGRSGQGPQRRRILKPAPYGPPMSSS